MLQMKKNAKTANEYPSARDSSVILSSADGTVFNIQINGVTDSTLTPSGTGVAASFLMPSTDLEIFPWGTDNLMPLNLFNLLREDNLSRPILKKVRGLFWGLGPHVEYGALKGPALERCKRFVASLGFERFMLDLFTDYFHTSCAAFLVLRNRGGSELATLRHVPVWQVRLAKKSKDPYMRPTHAVVADFSGTPTPEQAQVFPLFDPQAPAAHPVSLCFASDSDYFSNPYPLPDYVGGEAWILRSIEAPRVLGALIDNSMNIRWIIRIPSKYWKDMYDDIAKQMAEDPKSRGPIKSTDIQKAFEAAKAEKLKALTDMLAGAENVGKVYISDVIVEVFGNAFYEYKWEIEQVELKVRDYVESVIAMSNAADAKKTGAFSLHASLANVGQTGRADSGSEQLYAYTNHLNSSVVIPEMNVCRPVENILRAVAGAPDDTGIRIVFDRPEPMRQSDVTPADRMTAKKITT